MQYKIIIPLVLLILAIAAGYWVTQPKNYDECILKHINEAKTVLAANMIHKACRNQFPSPESDTTDFDFNEELKKFEKAIDR